MDWKNIPSLSALRAFEATARLENQSAAARELNVTHAAINQHIRALEQEFGKGLFVRDGKKISLSSEGERFYQLLNQGFGAIQLAVQELRQQQDDGLVSISVTPSIKERWLMERIERFRDENPDLRIKITSESRLVDLAQEGYHMALRYGRGSWPPLRAHFLFPSTDAIFASKVYLERHPEVRGNPEKGNWLLAQDSAEFFPIHKHYGIDADDPKHWILPRNVEARSALIAGDGLLAQDRKFLKYELEYGLVEEIAPVILPEDYGYYVVRTDRPLTPSSRRFLDWIKAEAKK